MLFQAVQPFAPLTCQWAPCVPWCKAWSFRWSLEATAGVGGFTGWKEKGLTSGGTSTQEVRYGPVLLYLLDAVPIVL